MLFKILFTGEHDNHEKGNQYEIYPLTSAVAFLDDGKGNKILFDSGSLAWQEKLLAELAALNVTPNEITHVLLTHFHLDHTANCVLFKNAEIHANRSMIDHKTGHCTVYRNFDDKILPSGIVMKPTPGHTSDHVSYFFEVAGVMYCFAGDAVRKDLFETGGVPHYLPEDRKLEFKKSLKLIFENCDVIIPGHFELLTGLHKQEYYNLID